MFAARIWDSPMVCADADTEEDRVLALKLLPIQTG
jgi:hypothetical protein